MDRLSTAGTQRNWESTNIVKQYMSDYGLCDAWRSSTPTVGNTFFSHVHHSYSRLDYFLVSSSLLSDISDTEIHPIAVSDHAAVSLTLVKRTHQVITGDSIHHCLKTTILLNILKKSGLYI